MDRNEMNRCLEEIKSRGLPQDEIDALDVLYRCSLGEPGYRLDASAGLHENFCDKKYRDEVEAPYTLKDFAQLMLRYVASDPGCKVPTKDNDQRIDMGLISDGFEAHSHWLLYVDNQGIAVQSVGQILPG